MSSFDRPYQAVHELMLFIANTTEYHKKSIRPLQECLNANPDSNICDWVHLFQIYFNLVSSGATLMMTNPLINGSLIKQLRQPTRESLR